MLLTLLSKRYQRSTEGTSFQVKKSDVVVFVSAYDYAVVLVVYHAVRLLVNYGLELVSLER